MRTSFTILLLVGFVLASIGNAEHPNKSQAGKKRPRAPKKEFTIDIHY